MYELQVLAQKLHMNHVGLECKLPPVHFEYVFLSLVKIKLPAGLYYALNLST